MDMLRQFFASPVMMESLMPALLVAVVTASMSVMIMAHRLSFLTVGVSHASLAGLGLAVIFALPLLPTATVVAVLVSLALAMMPKREGIGEDAGTGMLFAGSMAAGILMISSAKQTQVDLFGLLFGNILTIAPADLQWLWLLGGIILLTLVVAARSWWSIAFDPVTAAASGMAVGALRMLLYGMVGITVILCVKLAGIVLTTGLLVLPAAIAWFWGRSLAGLWLYSLIFSVTGTISGLIVSYAYDWPSGATVILALSGMFIISWGGAWLKQHVQKQ